MVGAALAVLMAAAGSRSQDEERASRPPLILTVICDATTGDYYPASPGEETFVIYTVRNDTASSDPLYAFPTITFGAGTANWIELSNSFFPFSWTPTVEETETMLDLGGNNLLPNGDEEVMGVMYLSGTTQLSPCMAYDNLGHASNVASIVVGAVSPCPGDIDGDHDTDVFDFGEFANAFGTMYTGDYTTFNFKADLDRNGVIDVFDFGIFAADFGCAP